MRSSLRVPFCVSITLRTRWPRVIDVIGRAAAAQIHLLQLVFEVPLHLHAVDGGHAAVNIVALRVV